MNNGIEDKVILITGGNSGIGAEVARLLAMRGAKIAVAARRQSKRIKPLHDGWRYS